MKFTVFCYKDKVHKIYGRPQFCIEDKEHLLVEASRGLEDLNSQQDEKSKSIRAVAKDQALYLLGYYEDTTGIFDLLSEPEKLFDCEDYLCKKE